MPLLIKVNPADSLSPPTVAPDVKRGAHERRCHHERRFDERVVRTWNAAPIATTLNPSTGPMGLIASVPACVTDTSRWPRASRRSARENY